MDNEKEIEFDFVLFSMGTRCMQRARDGIPHDTKRQRAWATNTLANWMNGNGLESSLEIWKRSEKVCAGLVKHRGM